MLEIPVERGWIHPEILPRGFLKKFHQYFFSGTLLVIPIGMSPRICYKIPSVLSRGIFLSILSWRDEIPILAKLFTKFYKITEIFYGKSSRIPGFWLILPGVFFTEFMQDSLQRVPRGICLSLPSSFSPWNFHGIFFQCLSRNFYYSFSQDISQTFSWYFSFFCNSFRSFSWHFSQKLSRNYL